MAIGPQYMRYADLILGILDEANKVSLAADEDDEDLIDYIDTLRVSIIEAYCGILHVSFINIHQFKFN